MEQSVYIPITTDYGFKTNIGGMLIQGEYTAKNPVKESYLGDTEYSLIKVEFEEGTYCVVMEQQIIGINRHDSISTPSGS